MHTPIGHSVHNLLTTSVHNLMTLTVHEVLTLYTNYADNRYRQPLFRSWVHSLGKGTDLLVVHGGNDDSGNALSGGL